MKLNWFSKLIISTWLISSLALSNASANSVKDTKNEVDQVFLEKWTIKDVLWFENFTENQKILDALELAYIEFETNYKNKNASTYMNFYLSKWEFSNKSLRKNYVDIISALLVWDLTEQESQLLNISISNNYSNLKKLIIEEYENFIWELNEMISMQENHIDSRIHETYGDFIYYWLDFDKIEWWIKEGVRFDEEWNPYTYVDYSDYENIINNAREIIKKLED